LSSQPRSVAGWLSLPSDPPGCGVHPLEAAVVSEPDPLPEEARREHLLHAQAVVEQAKGMLMARFGCGSDMAWELMRGASQYANVKVHVVAEQLIERGLE
jgi:ANTAR domain